MFSFLFWRSFSTHLTIADSMKWKLQDFYAPSFLNVLNEAGGDKFKVVVESEKFVGKTPLQRHWEINELLKDEISKIHAITIEATVPKKK